MLDLSPYPPRLSHRCQFLDRPPAGRRDPYLNLLAGIILRAWQDVLSGSPGHAADARVYLLSPNFRNDCEWLGLEPAAVLSRLDAMAQIVLNDDTLRAAHARYTEQELSLKDVAAELKVSSMTLSRGFARLGLPTRPPGTTAALKRAKKTADPFAALRELSRLLEGVDGRSVRVEVVVRIEE